MHSEDAPSLRSLAPANILSVLHLCGPGLEAAQEAAKAGDRVGALAALLEVYRQRFPLSTPSSNAANSAIAEADRTAAHVFQWGPYEPADYGHQIDWEWDPRGDIEWVAAVYRFHWAEALATAYAATRDERHACTFVELASDWMAKHPLEQRKRTHPVYSHWRGFAWLDIQTGIRATRICAAFRTLVHADAFTPEFLGVLLASLYDHQVKTEALPMGQVHNKAIFEQRGFMNVAYTFPEFRDSRRWLALGLERSRENLLAQTTIDGVQREWSFGYHLGVLRDAVEIMQRAEAADIPVPDDYRARVKGMHDYLFWVATPDLGAPMFGDAARPPKTSESRSDWPLYDALVAASEHTGDPRYAARANLQHELLPANGSHAFAAAGMVVMRNGWGPDQIHLGLHCSPPAISGHDQPDNGTFELYAFGRWLMPDTGFYTYGHDPQGRMWHRQTCVHQTLTLDGRDSATEGSLTLWHSDERMDALVVENNAYPDLCHRRSVWFVGKKYFIILDEALGNAAGILDLHYQFAPGDIVIDAQAQSVRTTFDDANVLLCYKAEQALEVAPEQGWFAWAYGHRTPRPAVRVRHPVLRAPAAFVTLLVPYRGRSAPHCEFRLPAAFRAGANDMEMPVSVDGVPMIVGRDLTRGRMWVRD